MDRTNTGQSASGVLFLSLIVIIVAGMGTLYVVLPGGAAGTTPGGGSGTATASDSAGSSSAGSTVVQSVDDGGRGLSLRVSLTPARAPSGTGFQLDASVVNTLARSNDVAGVDDYHGVGSNPVCRYAPVLFDVLEGYYTAGNFSSGTPLLVHGVQNYACVTPATDLSYYVFQPNSDNFTGPIKDGHGMQGSRLAAVSATIGQVYAAGAQSPVPLAPGEYTVIVADNWGQLVVLHFEVS
jgi:hypothetical protein